MNWDPGLYRFRNRILNRKRKKGQNRNSWRLSGLFLLRQGPYCLPEQESSPDLNRCLLLPMILPPVQERRHCFHRNPRHLRLLRFPLLLQTLPGHPPEVFQMQNHLLPRQPVQRLPPLRNPSPVTPPAAIQRFLQNRKLPPVLRPSVQSLRFPLPGQLCSPGAYRWKSTGPLIAAGLSLFDFSFPSSL